MGERGELPKRMIVNFPQAVFITCCNWLACSHTGYSLTLVPVTAFLPRKVATLHLLADLLSHLLAALLLKNRVLHGIFFLWHAAKYFVGQTNVPRIPAYLLDLADCFLWQPGSCFLLLQRLTVSPSCIDLPLPLNPQD